MRIIADNKTNEDLLKDVREALEPFKDRIKSIRINNGELVIDVANDYLEVKKAELVPDKYGSHIKISMIGLYNSSGKWQRWIKLNEAAVDKLRTTKIKL
jgi:hypothetical protein